MAAGTCVVSRAKTYYVNKEPKVKSIQIDWVASVDAATIPATTIPIPGNGLAGWKLYSVLTNPGTPAPDEYAITLIDSNAFDVANSLLLTRHASNTELTFIIFSTYHHPVVIGDLTFTIANQATNSAQGLAVLTFIV